MRAFCSVCQKEVEYHNWKSRVVKGQSVFVCGRHFKSSMPEFVPERIKDERVKNWNSIVQPYRGGKLSREYIEAHGAKGIDATPEEVKKSEYVWKDLPGFETRHKSK